MNALVPASTRQAVIHHAPDASRNPMVPRDLDGAIRLAEMMARSKIGIPEHLRNNPADCLLVVELATRWNMSAFALAQCTNKVKDKLGYEGKVVHAAIESCGAIEGYIDYDFTGSGDARTITVTATRAGDSQPRSVEVVYKDAKTDNQWWRKTPDQMLVYHGARVWARRWTPGVLLGVYAAEEFDDAPHHGQTVDATPVREPLTKFMPLADAIPPLESAKKSPDPIVNLRKNLALATDIQGVHRVEAAWAKFIERNEASGAPAPQMIVDLGKQMIEEAIVRVDGVFDNPEMDAAGEPEAEAA